MAKKTLAEKMKTMVGYCSCCGIEIMDLSVKGRARLLPNFCENELELSDGTIMPVGVCTGCKAKLVSGSEVQKTADVILANHKIYWSGKEKKERPQDFENFTVIDPNSDFNKWKQKKILKDHEDHLNRIKKLK